MNSKEILYALQNGKISPEDVEKEIIKIKNSLAERTVGSSTVTGGKPPMEEITCAAGEGLYLKTMEQGKETLVEYCEVLPGIVQVTMQDRYNKNTFSIELVTRLLEVFETIQNDSRYKVVIITGYDGYFACGGNKEAMQAIHEGKLKLTNIYLYRLALDCKIPVIAAMQGHAIGSGLCFGLYSDFIVMSHESTYTCNHMKYGFTPGDGATLILPEKLGVNLANELLFTGRKSRGSELQAKGVPIPVLPRKDVLPYAIELAKNLGDTPRDALILLKEHLTQSIKLRLPEIIKKEWEMQEKTYVNKPEIFENMMAAFEQSSKNHKEQKNQILSYTGFGMNVKVQNPNTNDTQKEYPDPKPQEGSLYNEADLSRQYPELIHLNHITNGRPIFWIHWETGGLEGYQAIAGKCSRPFYGIQARGRTMSHAPINGMYVMASYYVRIIRDVQQEGPYDVGGYSSGGVLAFEVARQLQEQGHEVETIVMVDTLDTDWNKKAIFSQETKMLQAVNLSLLYRIRQEPHKMISKLIHKNEITPAVSGEMFLQYLVTLGKTRGLSLTKTEKELYHIFNHGLNIQSAFELDKFQVLPLPHPKTAACYYFRNRNGAFLGEFEPYFLASGDKMPEVIPEYWNEWQQQISNFHLIDVEASSHTTLLFESKAYERIAECCERLYSEDGTVNEFLCDIVKEQNTVQEFKSLKKPAKSKAVRTKKLHS